MPRIVGSALALHVNLSFSMRSLYAFASNEAAAASPYVLIL